MAQVFNERGDGVVVRGGQVVPDKSDRQPHLNRDDAESLLRVALGHYRDEHKTLPARAVLHKSSFIEGEVEGFKAAAEAERVSSLELIWIGDSDTKLFRPAVYPPLRETLWELDPVTAALYTRGSVDFFTAYPGMYVPRPLRLRFEDVVQTATFLAQEVLALTKMNWNSTQFDNRDPITIRAARQVGSILKHVPENGFLRPRYASTSPGLASAVNKDVARAASLLAVAVLIAAWLCASGRVLAALAIRNIAPRSHRAGEGQKHASHCGLDAAPLRVSVGR